MKRQFFITLLCTLMCVSFSATAQITWPQGQILPTFPTTASHQDLIYINGDISAAEMYLFSSLKGVVNRTQPRIFSYEGDAHAEGPYAWLQSLGLTYSEHSDRWAVLKKYLSEVKGLVVYDPDQIHTVNLATIIAHEKEAIIASPTLLTKLTKAPYSLPILVDLREKGYKSKMEIYQEIYDDYWPKMDKRVLISISPEHHKASIREYATALGSAVVWLDPKLTSESALLAKFLSDMPVGGRVLGWWTEEGAGIAFGSKYGIPTIPSDYCTNLTVHSGMSRLIEPQPMPAKPTLENKIYVAFILSDGDNMQYVEHLMRKLWNNPDRGSVPIGWTISPAMVDAMPGALNYYHKSATNNDNLVSGPSGHGYAYPNNITSKDALANYIQETEKYNVEAGISVVTVWNTITGGINGSVGNAYADNSSTLLGLTAQNTGGAMTIYRRSLPGKPLSCNYCTNEQAMKDHIASGAKGWDGKSPRFLIIQAQPWQNVTPTSFKNVMNSLDKNTYSVVRPDQIFQLIRESANLPVNPGFSQGKGVGMKGTYYSDKNFETEVGSRVDPTVNFYWNQVPPMAGMPANNFSVSWTGQLQAGFSGLYTFSLLCDNVARLWIDDEQVINKKTTTQSTVSGKIKLEAGKRYAMRLEYVGGQKPVCKLEWASAFQSREVIPTAQLYDNIYMSTAEVDDASGLRVYFDSSSAGTLTVELENSFNETMTVALYDTRGQLLLTDRFQTNTHQLDVSSLEQGVYLVAVTAGDYSKVVKCVIP